MSLRLRCRDRYILGEVALPFGVGLLLFFALFAFGNLLMFSDNQTGVGIGPQDFLWAVLYSMPSLLAILLPVAWFFATLLGVGRLAADGELRAMMALGLSPAKMVGVPVLGGLIIAVLSAWLGLYGEPWGLAGLRSVMAHGAQRALLAGVEPGRFYSWAAGVSFMAQGREDGMMTKLVLTDQSKDAKPMVITAGRGQMLRGPSPEQVVLHLYDGEMLLYASQSQEHDLVSFKEGRYVFDVGHLVRQKLKNVTQAQGMYPKELWSAAKDEAHYNYDQRAAFLVTFHRKIAIAWASVIFALIAFPLAAVPTRSARARGLVLSVAVVAGYYYLGRALELWSRAGHLPPMLAPWIPNIVGIVWGLALLRWMRRYF